MNGKRLIALSAVALLAACSDGGTEPEPPVAFDVQAALADYRALGRVLASPTLASFRAMGARVSLGAGPAAAPGGPARVELISAEARGTTFVYDPASDAYVAAPERTGAPGNGVRFILYALDEATGKPDVSRETGHADLLDNGRPDLPPLSLRFIVENEGVVRMDYAVTAAGSQTMGALGTTGFLSDGNERLNFGISVSGVRDGTSEASQFRFQLGMERSGFQAAATASGLSTAEGTTSGIELSARHGESTVQVSIVNADDGLSATFRVNGQVLATASGDPADPVFVGASGAELTDQEKEALGHIMQLTGQVFGLFNGLMDPADDLIGLGVAL